MLFGIVENVTDPLKLGRVRVRVYGSHDNRQGDEYNIKEEDLAWSEVMMPGNTPAKSGVGHSVNLLVGTLVCGMFKDPANQEFMVMGTVPTKTDGTEDNNVRVRAEANPHADEPKGDYQPASTYAPEYPYNNVFETESGHVKEYDDTKGHERITERHMSGTQYEICADGTKNETIVRDNYRLVVGHDTLEVFGNVRIIVSGQADIAVANDVNLAVGGNLAADVKNNANITIEEGNLIGLISKGNCDFTISEGTTTVKSEGLIKLDAADVEITGNLTLTKEGILVNTHTHEYTAPLHAAGDEQTDKPTPNSV